MLIQEEEPQNAKRIEHNMRENGKKRPEMLLNIFQCIGKSPTIKMFLSQIFSSSKAKKNLVSHI